MAAMKVSLAANAAHSTSFGHLSPEVPVGDAAVEQRCELAREQSREGCVDGCADGVDESDLHLRQLAHLVSVHHVDGFYVELFLFEIT